MINILSQLNIIDNSGAKSGKMIKRLDPKTSIKKSPASIGHVISISIKKTIPQKKNKVKRKNVYQALIVRTKKIHNFIFKKDLAFYTPPTRHTTPTGTCVGPKMELKKKLSSSSLQKKNIFSSSSSFSSSNPSSLMEKTSNFSDLNNISPFNEIFPIYPLRPDTLPLRGRVSGLGPDTHTLCVSGKNYYFNQKIKSHKLGGHTISWDDNAAVLIKFYKGEFQPIGTRIKGPIGKSLKLQKGCLKIVSISSIN